ncbi:hypothetical protein D3C81_1726110 [compost metagenome]
MLMGWVVRKMVSGVAKEPSSSEFGRPSSLKGMFCVRLCTKVLISFTKTPTAKRLSASGYHSSDRSRLSDRVGSM